MNGKALEQLSAFAMQQSESFFAKAKRASGNGQCARMTKRGLAWEKIGRRGLERRKQEAARAHG